MVYTTSFCRERRTLALSVFPLFNTWGFPNNYEGRRTLVSEKGVFSFSIGLEWRLIQTIPLGKLQSECATTSKRTGHFSGLGARNLTAVGFERQAIGRVAGHTSARPLP